MPVDAVRVVGVGIREIACQSGHNGKFITGLRIEVGVADAAVDCAMADAEIRQTVGIVGADRDVPGCVDHVIVDAVVPFHHRDRIEVAKTGDGAADVFGADRDNRTESGRQRSGQVGARSADEPPHAQGQLPAENRGREGVVRLDPFEAHLGVKVRGQVGRQRRGEAADLDFARGRHVGTGLHVRVVGEGEEGPSRRRLGNCRKATEQAGQPKAYPAFVSQCDRRK